MALMSIIIIIIMAVAKVNIMAIISIMCNILANENNVNNSNIS